MLPEKEKKPVGKVFKFKEEDLKFGASNSNNSQTMVAGKLYLCREIIHTREKMSFNDSMGDSKESGIFMEVTPEGVVLENTSIEATTNWWSTQVSLLKDRVVGEIEIETKVVYNVKSLPKDELISQALAEFFGEPEPSVDHDAFSLDKYIGRALTEKESQEIADYVNSLFGEIRRDFFTVQELKVIAKEKPLDFKQIMHLGHSTEMDEEIISDLIFERIELKEQIENTETPICFDFTVSSQQVASTQAMLKKRIDNREFDDEEKEKEMNSERIAFILSQDTGLFFDAFDGTIDDTYARDFYFELMENYPI